MNRSALVACALALAGCPKSGDKKPVEPSGKRDAGGNLLPSDDSATTVTLPPAPPLPELEPGLPALPAREGITPEAVALGELLFHDARLSVTARVACATCHDPAQGYGGAARQDTAAGKSNLRRAPALVNLAWVTAFGWDGRYPSIAEQLPSHVRGQLGDDLATSVARLVDLPLYRAHFARIGGAAPETAAAALSAFVLTRYAGNAPWDRLERDPNAPANLKAGYQLFTGKARCSTCHTPPLYTDLDYHRLGLIAVADEGRGRIDKAKTGAFRTPTLRGASRHRGFFHDASANSLDAALDWHLAGGAGQGADPSIVDVKKVALSPLEREELKVFVEALTATGPAPVAPPLP